MNQFKIDRDLAQFHDSKDLRFSQVNQCLLTDITETQDPMLTL